MTGPTGESLVREILSREVANWLHFDPLARDGQDPEGVHQLRVSARRLRAEIAVLERALSAKPSERIGKDLRWIGSVLGRQRDLDVLYELLRHVERDDAPFDESVLARLRRQAEHEHRRVIDALSSSRYEALVRQLASWAVSPPLRRRARKSAASILLPGVLNALSSLFEHVDDLGPNPSDESLHRLRIAIKHVRYRCEVAAPALGSVSATIAKDLAKAQGVLGDLHDRAVASDFLVRWRASRWPVDADGSHQEPVSVALDELGDEMSNLRRLWRPHVARARHRSTALYLEEPFKPA